MSTGMSNSTIESDAIYCTSSFRGLLRYACFYFEQHLKAFYYYNYYILLYIIIIVFYFAFGYVFLINLCCRCSVSLAPSVLKYADEILQQLYVIIQSIISASSNISLSSALLSEWLGLLSDFSEATPLSSLPLSTLGVMVSVSHHTLMDSVFNQLRKLLPRYTASTSESVKHLGAVVIEDRDELSSFFIEILTKTLNFADNIASSDVSIAVRGITSAGSISENAIDTILSSTILMLSSEIITVEMLNSFRPINDNFLSITNLVLRSHCTGFAATWLSFDSGLTTTDDVHVKIRYVKKLFSQIICSIDSGDVIMAQSALQTIKSFTNYFKQLLSSTPEMLPLGQNTTVIAQLASLAISESANLFLCESLSHMLQMMLPNIPIIGRNSGINSSFISLLLLLLLHLLL